VFRIPELVERMDISFSCLTSAIFLSRVCTGAVPVLDSKLLVKEVRPLYAYPLKNYLHERSIPVAVADAFCKEVILSGSADGLTMVSGFKMMPAAGRSVTKISSKAVRRRILPVLAPAQGRCMFSRALWTFFLM
jgi:hypothetical protein